MIDILCVLIKYHYLSTVPGFFMVNAQKFVVSCIAPCPLLSNVLVSMNLLRDYMNSREYKNLIRNSYCLSYLAKPHPFVSSSLEANICLTILFSFVCLSFYFLLDNSVIIMDNFAWITTVLAKFALVFNFISEGLQSYFIVIFNHISKVEIENINTFKDLSIGISEINLNWDVYTKKDIIYNDKGLCVDTKPLGLKEGMIVKDKLVQSSPVKSLALIPYVKPQLSLMIVQSKALISYEPVQECKVIIKLPYVSLTEAGENDQKLVLMLSKLSIKFNFISNQILSWFKIRIQRLHDKIFTQEFAEKLALYLARWIKRRIQRWILFSWIWSLIKPYFDSMIQFIEPYSFYILDYLGLYIGYSSFVFVIYRILCHIWYEKGFNCTINSFEDTMGLSVLEAAYSRLELDIRAKRSEYILRMSNFLDSKSRDQDTFSLIKKNVTQEFRDQDDYLIRYEKDNDPNNIPISCLFIGPDNIGKDRPVASRYEKLRDLSQKSILTQKNRLENTINSNLTEDLKSQYINIACDEMIRIKMEYNDSIELLKTKRAQLYEGDLQSSSNSRQSSQGITEQVKTQYDTGRPVQDALKRLELFKPDNGEGSSRSNQPLSSSEPQPVKTTRDSDLIGQEIRKRARLHSQDSDSVLYTDPLRDPRDPVRESAPSSEPRPVKRPRYSEIDKNKIQSGNGEGSSRTNLPLSSSESRDSDLVVERSRKRLDDLL